MKSGKGSDILYIKGVNSLDELDFNKNGRDLVISNTVNGDLKNLIVQNYFTTSGKATKSSVKTIRLQR